MKRLFFIALLLTTTVFAVGPKIPYWLTFTPSPSPGVTGYWLYWRTPSGVYSDTQRLALPTNSYAGFDLRVLGLAKGTYIISGTATNATSESDLSAEAVWDYTNPNKPSNLSVQ